jgi:hypothetical protein
MDPEECPEKKLLNASGSLSWHCVTMLWNSLALVALSSPHLRTCKDHMRHQLIK